MSEYESPVTSRRRSASFRSTSRASTARQIASSSSSRSTGASAAPTGEKSSVAFRRAGRRSAARISSMARFFATWKSQVVNLERSENFGRPWKTRRKISWHKSSATPRSRTSRRT